MWNMYMHTCTCIPHMENVYLEFKLFDAGAAGYFNLQSSWGSHHVQVGNLKTNCFQSFLNFPNFQFNVIWKTNLILLFYQILSTNWWQPFIITVTIVTFANWQPRFGDHLLYNCDICHIEFIITIFDCDRFHIAATVWWSPFIILILAKLHCHCDLRSHGLVITLPFCFLNTEVQAVVRTHWRRWLMVSLVWQFSHLNILQLIFTLVVANFVL